MLLSFWVLAAYLVGSLTFGLYVGKLIKGVDIREHGSGNLGATNVFRVIGKRWGIVVLLLDALKGYFAVWVPTQLIEMEVPVYFPLILAVGAILGHTFPIWLKFKGGKGVATSLGVFLAVAPVPTLICFGLFFVILFSSKILSLGSLIAAFAFPIACTVTMGNQDIFAYLLPISLILAVFIIFTHRANIQRILGGEEKKLF